VTRQLYYSGVYSSDLFADPRLGAADVKCAGSGRTLHETIGCAYRCSSTVGHRALCSSSALDGGGFRRFYIFCLVSFVFYRCTTRQVHVFDWSVLWANEVGVAVCNRRCSCISYCLSGAGGRRQASLVSIPALYVPGVVLFVSTWALEY